MTLLSCTRTEHFSFIAPEDPTNPPTIDGFRPNRWNDLVTGWFASHRRRPRWTASTPFGIVTGSDEMADGSRVLI